MLPVTTRRKPQTELLEAARPTSLHSLSGGWRGCPLDPVNSGSGDSPFQIVESIP
jgi:hypothetical protein